MIRYDIVELFKSRKLEVVWGMIVPMTNEDKLLANGPDHWLVVLGRDEIINEHFISLWLSNEDGMCFRDRYEIVLDDIDKETMYELCDNWSAHFATTPSYKVFYPEKQ